MFTTITKHAKAGKKRSDTGFLETFLSRTQGCSGEKTSERLLATIPGWMEEITRAIPLD